MRKVPLLFPPPLLPQSLFPRSTAIRYASSPPFPLPGGEEGGRLPYEMIEMVSFLYPSDWIAALFFFFFSFTLLADNNDGVTLSFSMRAVSAFFLDICSFVENGTR